MKEVLGLRRVCSTALARSTKPPYIDWKSRKNSAMSAKKAAPRIRSATTWNGLEASVTSREREGAMSQRNSRLEKNSAIRAGASRKSMAWREGGVSTTIRS